MFFCCLFFLTCQTIEIYSNNVTSAGSVHLSYVGLCAHTHRKKRSGHSQRDEAWTKSGIGLFPQGGLGVRAFLIRKTSPTMLLLFIYSSYFIYPKHRTYLGRMAAILTAVRADFASHFRFFFSIYFLIKPFLTNLLVDSPLALILKY